MEIKQLKLIHYRNYDQGLFSFTGGTNIIYGNNGQGKTNLLESIFVLCRGYSHRSNKITDLIRFGDDAMSIQASFRTADSAHRIRLTASSGRKKWELDGKTESGFQRISRLTGCILFEPDDLEIVKAGPERRRSFINEELSGLNPVYRSSLRNYERVRSQRNALLKDIRFRRLSQAEAAALLSPWNSQLADAAESIFKDRADYLLKLNREAKKLHHKMSGTDETLSLEYQSNVFSDFRDLENIRSIYLKKLDENLASDIERGHTAAGPHADELVVKINGVPARQFASQGQQRTAAISLKLAHIELYREKNGEAPVVLLDDILSELDARRQKNLLSVLRNAQSFITCTDPAFADTIARGTIDAGKQAATEDSDQAAGDSDRHQTAEMCVSDSDLSQSICKYQICSGKLIQEHAPD